MQPEAGAQRRAPADRLAFFLLKQVNRAVREFQMIGEGDRIAVAVSGGKDSLALLRLLRLRQETARERYDLVAIHITADASGLIPLHEPLREWLAGLDIPYRIVQPTIADDEALPMGCQRCSRLRRKTLFTAAEEMGCNVLAFGHHADDAAQTTLLNVLYNASPATLRPTGTYFEGRFRLIRPLFFVPETELARLARLCGFPPAPPVCLRAEDSRRRLVANLLRSLGRDYLLHVRNNLIRVGLREIPELQE